MIVVRAWKNPAEKFYARSMTYFWSSYALKLRGRRTRAAYEIVGITDLVCWRYYRQRQQKSPEEQQLSEVASILLIIGNSVRTSHFGNAMRVK